MTVSVSSEDGSTTRGLSPVGVSDVWRSDVLTVAVEGQSSVVEVQVGEYHKGCWTSMVKLGPADTGSGASSFPFSAIPPEWQEKNLRLELRLAGQAGLPHPSAWYGIAVLLSCLRHLEI